MCVCVYVRVCVRACVCVWDGGSARLYLKSGLPAAVSLLSEGDGVYGTGVEVHL